MGRRRRMRRVISRRAKPELLRCPACQHNSILIDVKRKEEKAEITCLECGLREEMHVYRGEEDVDVYTRFYDDYFERE